MPDRQHVRRKPFVFLCLFVCTAGTLVGGCFGHEAALMPGYGVHIVAYDAVVVHPVMTLGKWLGASSGLLAGYIWCRVMIPRAIRKGPVGLVTVGTLLGLAVGVLSTAMLHAGLMISVGEWLPEGIIFGLVCGVPAGLVVGIVCGVACQWAAKAACPNKAAEDTVPTP